MIIKLYDSLKQTKVALPEGKITIYNCGPTVYNHIHLGNLRPVIIFDFLVRYLRAINYQVVYVHNITDIDDKIIAQSKIVGCCAKKIAATYTNEYLKIMRTMNWVVPDHLPQVSTNIPMIIAYIEKLLRLGFGYQVGGDVLFAINRVEEYGELSKQKTSQLYVNTRNTVTTNKQQVQDFFLWKQTHDLPNWPSPWSSGRPGWHTECVCFINNLIGEQTTIHGGGVDLKFPHHENENVQNRAMCSRPLAQIWFHIGTLTINQQKMAKSLNNFILVKDLVAKYDPDVLRYFFMLTNYKQNQDFNFQTINQAHAQLASFYYAINLARTHLVINHKYQTIKHPNPINQNFCAAMNDDLNLPNVLSWLTTIKNKLHQVIKEKKIADLSYYLEELLTHLKLLGFKVPNQHNADLITKIHQWQNLLKTQNYKTADLIRAKLIQKKVW